MAGNAQIRDRRGGGERGIEGRSLWGGGGSGDLWAIGVDSADELAIDG